MCLQLWLRQRINEFGKIVGELGGYIRCKFFETTSKEEKLSRKANKASIRVI